MKKADAEPWSQNMGPTGIEMSLASYSFSSGFPKHTHFSFCLPLTLINNNGWKLLVQRSLMARHGTRFRSQVGEESSGCCPRLSQ